jgi:hypothetical protein
MAFESLVGFRNESGKDGLDESFNIVISACIMEGVDLAAGIGAHVVLKHGVQAVLVCDAARSHQDLKSVYPLRHRR